jgi:hypothetical protein
VRKQINGSLALLEEIKKQYGYPWLQHALLEKLDKKAPTKSICIYIVPLPELLPVDIFVVNLAFSAAGISPFIHLWQLWQLV